MRELCKDVESWFNEGVRVALATVVKTWGSSPRAAGSVMAVDERGRMCGSVSGGCVEGSVVEAALDCLDSGSSSLEEFHATMEKAHEVGLSCGGSIDVLVANLDAGLFFAERSMIESNARYVRLAVAKSTCADLLGQAILVAGPGRDGEGGDCAGVERIELQNGGYAVVSTARPAAFSDETVQKAAAEALRRTAREKTGTIALDTMELFFTRCDPVPQLVCVGGVHIAIHLARMASMLGYRTIVIDPRKTFSTAERFSFVDELVHEWPQEAFKHVELTSATAVCALTHDPKIDVPALSAALGSPAFYIGSLGRYTTQLSRYRELRECGHTDERIGRIYGPIGLDLRGKEPAEIALSVMAEITAVANGSELSSATMVESAHRALAEEQGKAVREARKSA